MSPFTGSSGRRPAGLGSSLVLGRWHFQGEWLQGLATSSNLQVLLTC